ncbi:hypothetical protein D4764_07G0007130 [Takifugu flavidus]|uniref:Reverse transcriptase domain-containing protein n=1 Tax=Takifugu flavidus TaxID=433684 RepID=A0A5C6MRS5_9TELE|nr:hypothetical protein D4764_07G0007130 [Takifugu flavidus]
MRVSPRGSIDQLFNLAGVLEGSWEFAQPVHMCFVDVEKAYDQVPRSILWGVLQEYRVEGPLIRAVQSLAWKKVECLLRVGEEVLPQVEEFKYFGILFTSESRMEREIDRRIGVASAVMRALNQSSWVTRLSLRDRVRSSDIREELGVEPLLLHIERSQLGWLGHLARMSSGRLPLEVFQICPTRRRPRGRPRTRWRDYIPRLAWERLGVPPEELMEVAGERPVWASLLKLLPL